MIGDISSYRGVWKQGDRFDGLLWNFTGLDLYAKERFKGFLQRLQRGDYDAVEVRLRGGQLVRVRRRACA